LIRAPRPAAGACVRPRQFPTGKFPTGKFPSNGNATGISAPFRPQTKLPWRIERDYQELKQELGFADYDGRGWRGLHHHATLCIAAYGFLIAKRGALPPSGPASAGLLSGSAVPDGYRPRGAADPTRTTRPKLDRQPAATANPRTRQEPPETPLLQRADPQNTTDARLLTQ
jgi:hypothetical protein